jgi:hypothetical protein
VNFADSMPYLKNKLDITQGILVPHQCLFYKGKYLEDKNYLSIYYIGKDLALILVLPLHG